MMKNFFIKALGLCVCLAGAAHASSLKLQLPTENHHLFTGQLDRFYMYVDRNFEGQVSKPWEGGGYGFVRTPIRVGGEVVLTKFHEGIDISPVKRDRAGNPMDLVMSIADGVVVYCCPVVGRSNYGKYVVVEHQWEGSPVLSLYAHLAQVTCEVGDRVTTGSVLGQMGYTGAGLNRTRAHVHLEVCLLSSQRYDDWHARNFGSLNHHGVFNGMNLMGADVAELFLEHRKNPGLQFSEFIAAQPAYFKVVVPAKGNFEFYRRYPWLGNDSQAVGNASWEITFTATGLPKAISASSQVVKAPVVTAVKASSVPHRHLTRNLLTGEGNEASLTRGGQQLVSLLTDEF